MTCSEHELHREQLKHSSLLCMTFKALMFMKQETIFFCRLSLYVINKFICSQVSNKLNYATVRNIFRKWVLEKLLVCFLTKLPHVRAALSILQVGNRTEAEAKANWRLFILTDDRHKKASWLASKTFLAAS